MNITFTELDELKKHLAEEIKANLTPLVEKVEPRLNALEDKQGKQDKAIGQLQNNQAKALVGWTILVAGITMLFSHIKEFLASLLTGHSHS